MQKRYWIVFYFKNSDDYIKQNLLKTFNSYFLATFYYKTKLSYFFKKANGRYFELCYYDRKTGNNIISCKHLSN